MYQEALFQVGQIIVYQLFCKLDNILFNKVPIVMLLWKKSLNHENLTRPIVWVISLL